MLRSIAWHGMRAVEFSKGDYAALLVPDMGANLVRLADTRRGIEILRAPAGDEVEEFRRHPALRLRTRGRMARPDSLPVR